MTTPQLDVGFWGKLSVTSKSTGKKPGLLPMLTAATLNDELSSESSARSDMSSGDDSDDSDEMDVQQPPTTRGTAALTTVDGVPVKQPRYSKLPRTAEQQHRAQSEYYKEQIDQLLQAEERMDERRNTVETLEREYQARLWQHQRDLLHFEGWRQQNPPQPQLRARSPVVSHFLQQLGQQGDSKHYEPLDVDHVTDLLSSYRCEGLLLKEALGQLKLVHGMVQFPRYRDVDGSGEHRPYAVVVALDTATQAVLFYIVHAVSM
jgi:hypothetical protein